MNPLLRLAYAAIGVACFGMLAYGIYYLQGELGLEPCPMCILQRYAFIAIGATAIVAAIHGPQRLGLRIYSAIMIVFALAGGGVATWHSYLQHYPPKVETCGTDLEFILNTFSLGQALPKIFAGTGSCSKIDWKFLGLSIPEWALVWFIAFAAFAAWAAFIRKPRA